MRPWGVGRGRCSSRSFQHVFSLTCRSLHVLLALCSVGSGLLSRDVVMTRGAESRGANVLGPRPSKEGSYAGTLNSSHNR